MASSVLDADIDEPMRRAYELVHQRRRQCAACRHQVSLTAGTVLHRTKIPLTHWFWAAYLMTTDKRGVSALLLQRQLGLSCYETAWMMLHKLRRAMVNAAREPLHREVEVDETWVGGEQAGLRGSRQLKGRRAALVLVAVEKRGKASGRVRMRVIPDFKALEADGRTGTPQAATYGTSDLATDSIGTTRPRAIRIEGTSLCAGEEGSA